MNTSTHFFGVDVRQLKQDWLLALGKIANWPALRWLTPAFVTCIQVDRDHFADYAEDSGKLKLDLQPKTTQTRFKGILLPDDLVLWYPMVLPKLKPEEIASAVELQVKSVSPFPANDVVWSHAAPRPAQDIGTTHVAIASRKIVETYIASQSLPQHAPNTLEVWVEAPQEQGFLVLRGFGESRRKILAARWRNINFGFLFLLAATAFIAAATPTMQLRLRAIEASQSFTKLQTLATPALKQRERLVRLDQQSKELQAQLQQSTQPEQILRTVTMLLPDDTYITSLQAQGTKVSLTGQTPNTATLMQQLGTQPGISNVRAPSAAIKQRGSERETFNLEFTLDNPTVLSQP